MNKIKKAGKVDTSVPKGKKSKINKGGKKTKIIKYRSQRILGSLSVKIGRGKGKAKKPRKISLISQKQLQQHLDNRGNYIFTKQQQKQYEKLNKRFTLSKLEFLKLYYGVRKANAKGARLAKENDVLYHVKYSTKFKRIMDRYDYNTYMKSIMNVLDPKYKEKRNKEFKDRFMRNIEYILSDAAAKKVNDIVRKMSAEQLASFIEENPDLEKVMYESKPDNFSSFDKEATSMIENRLNEFLGKDIPEQPALELR